MEESRWWCCQGYWLSLNEKVINAVACVGNAIAYRTNVTRYIGIVSTYNAIVTPTITNVTRYIGIVAGQVNGTRIKCFVVKGALRTGSNA